MLQHAESEGALVRDRSTIMSATSDSTLTSSLGKSQDVKACTERLTTSIDPVEQPSSPDVEPKLCPLPCEGSLEQDCYKEDVLMGDDQVADFASSVLAAISCWQYKARALLSTHFTTVRVSATHGFPISCSIPPLH